MTTKQLFRKMAQMYHPDRQGGDNTIMTRINACRHDAAKLEALAVELGVIKLKTNCECFFEIFEGRAFVSKDVDPELNRPPNFIINPYLVGISARGSSLRPVWCSAENLDEVSACVATGYKLISLKNHYRYEDFPPHLIVQYKNLYQRVEKQRAIFKENPTPAAAEGKNARGARGSYQSPPDDSSDVKKARKRAAATVDEALREAAAQVQEAKEQARRAREQVAAATKYMREQAAQGATQEPADAAQTDNVKTADVLKSIYQKFTSLHKNSFTAHYDHTAPEQTTYEDDERADDDNDIYQDYYYHKGDSRQILEQLEKYERSIKNGQAEHRDGLASKERSAAPNVKIGKNVIIGKSAKMGRNER